MNYLRRDALEIFLEIIENIGVPIAQTKLRLKVNMSHTPFIKYTDLLINMGFIMKIPSPRTPNNKIMDSKIKFLYKITNKGIELLNQVSHKPLSELLAFRSFDIMEEIS